jgi:hypothetical protein
VHLDGVVLPVVARERVGIVPSARVIVPKLERKKPKHKKKLEEEGA